MIMNLVNRCLLILLGLYPIAAVSSQSLLDLIMILISLIWFFSIYKKGYNEETRLYFFGAEKPLLMYFIIVVLGFIFNASPDAPWLESLLKFSWVLNLYILIYALRSSILKIENVLKYILILIFLPTLYSLIGYYNGVDLITGRDNSRITGLVNSATYHAHGNAIIFVFLLSLFIFYRKNISNKFQFLLISSLMLLGVSIFLTFTRGIWLSIALSSLTMSFLYSRKRVFQTAVAIVLIFGALFFFMQKARDRITPLSQDASANERINFLKVNFEMWREYPLLGIGYGENLRRNREYWDRPEWNMPQEYNTSHAHNQFVNVLSTTGVFGLIAFLWFMFLFLYKNFKLLRKSSVDKLSTNYILLFSCLWAQVEFYFACLTDVSFEYAKIRALLILVWALIIALEKSSKYMTGNSL